MHQTHLAWRLVQIGCGLGLIHAGFSLYWALGGSWLLDTVGLWAVDLTRTNPLAAFWGLLLIAAVKSSSFPPAERGRTPARAPGLAHPELDRRSLSGALWWR